MLERGREGTGGRKKAERWERSIHCPSAGWAAAMGRDGTGRGGSQPVPASLRAVGPEGACSPRPLHSREVAAEALPRDSGRLGRGGRALRSRGPLAPCGAGCGEGERRPKWSALLPAPISHEVPAGGSPSLAARKGEVRLGRSALLRTCSCFPASFYPLLSKGLRRVLFLGSLLEGESRARRARR